MSKNDHKTRNTVLIAVAGLLVAAYLLGPVFAAAFEVHDRWGPKIYPIWYHEFVYMLAWDLGSHDAKKPRVGGWYKPEHRPWFYGMYCKNHDPTFRER